MGRLLAVCMVLFMWSSHRQLHEFEGVFQIKSEFEGTEECLESSCGAEGLSLQPCNGGKRQLWAFRLMEENRYALQVIGCSMSLCLEGNRADAEHKGGASFLNSCQEVSGQEWIVETAGLGLYRLKTKFRGDDECLYANKNGDSHSGKAFMAKCRSLEGQLWRIVKVSD